MQYYCNAVSSDALGHCNICIFLYCTDIDGHISRTFLVNSLHALSGLPGDVNQLEQLQFGVLDMQVFIEAASFTPLCHNGQVIFGHVAHK